MSFGTLIVCGAAFAAGVVAGVFLNEHGILTTKTLERGGRFVMDKTQSVIAPEKAPVQDASTKV